MTASKLRFVLAGAVVLLAGIVVGAMWYLQQLLGEQVRATDHVKIDASISEQEIGKLKQLQIELAEKKDLVARAKQIAASADQYQYQDQIISDLTVYASRNGFGINSFDFSQATAGKKPGAAPSGKTAFLISLDSPIAYDRFLQFVRDVEQNLTKIQITSITLSPNPKNPQEILNPTISLEVYLKQ